MTTEPATGAPERAADPQPAVEALSFDDAFAELRAVVAELEAGGLSLEETIARTERAVALQRHCERLLGEAELRVQQLISRPGGALEVKDIAADEATEG
jgi:exodeoxyribonuclease VII small subunit